MSSSCSKKGSKEALVVDFFFRGGKQTKIVQMTVTTLNRSGGGGDLGGGGDVGGGAAVVAVQLLLLLRMLPHQAVRTAPGSLPTDQVGWGGMRCCQQLQAGYHHHTVRPGCHPCLLLTRQLQAPRCLRMRQPAARQQERGLRAG